MCIWGARIVHIPGFAEYDAVAPEKSKGTISIATERLFLSRKTAMLCGETKAVVMYHFMFHRITGWWFGVFFIFTYIGNNHPN